MRRLNALPRLSKHFRNPAQNTSWHLLRWSAARITIRFSCRALPRSRCCSSLAAKGTATVPTNTPRQKTSNAEALYSRRLWRLSPHDFHQDVYSKFSNSLFCKRRADLCVTWPEYGIDEIAAFVIRQKRALHRVDGDDLEILQRQAKGFRCRLEFLGHGRIAHQAVVGV